MSKKELSNDLKKRLDRPGDAGPSGEERKDQEGRPRKRAAIVWNVERPEKEQVDKRLDAALPAKEKQQEKREKPAKPAAKVDKGSSSRVKDKEREREVGSSKGKSQDRDRDVRQGHEAGGKPSEAGGGKAKAPKIDKERKDKERADRERERPRDREREERDRQRDREWQRERERDDRQRDKERDRQRDRHDKDSRGGDWGGDRDRGDPRSGGGRRGGGGGGGGGSDLASPHSRDGSVRDAPHSRDGSGREGPQSGDGGRGGPERGGSGYYPVSPHGGRPGSRGGPPPPQSSPRAMDMPPGFRAPAPRQAPPRGPPPPPPLNPEELKTRMQQAARIKQVLGGLTASESLAGPDAAGALMQLLNTSVETNAGAPPPARARPRVSERLAALQSGSLRLLENASVLLPPHDTLPTTQPLAPVAAAAEAGLTSINGLLQVMVDSGDGDGA